MHNNGNYKKKTWTINLDRFGEPESSANGFVLSAEQRDWWIRVWVASYHRLDDAFCVAHSRGGSMLATLHAHTQDAGALCFIHGSRSSRSGVSQLTNAERDREPLRSFLTFAVARW
jgi:hypothetical protein